VETISLVIAINRYFGRKEGQGLSSFAKEIGSLTQEDKEQLAKELSLELNVGITIY